MKGDFRYAQRYVTMEIVNGELVPTGHIWTKGANGKYSCPTLPLGLWTQEEVDIAVMNKSLLPVESGYGSFIPL